MNTEERIAALEARIANQETILSAYNTMSMCRIALLERNTYERLFKIETRLSGVEKALILTSGDVKYIREEIIPSHKKAIDNTNKRIGELPSLDNIMNNVKLTTSITISESIKSIMDSKVNVEDYDQDIVNLTDEIAKVACRPQMDMTPLSNKIDKVHDGIDEVGARLATKVDAFSEVVTMVNDKIKEIEGEVAMLTNNVHKLVEEHNHSVIEKEAPISTPVYEPIMVSPIKAPVTTPSKVPILDPENLKYYFGKSRKGKTVKFDALPLVSDLPITFQH